MTKPTAMHSGRWWLAIALMLLMICRGGLGQGATLRAGAAAIDITPTNLPIRTAGSLSLTRVNQVRDPLHARALVLQQGTTRIALAFVDSCMIGREDLDEAKAIASRATGIPVENLLIAATHSHTAPAVYGCHGNEAEPAYRAFLIQRLAESIVAAWRNLAPARAAWGKTDLPEFVHCRRWLMQPGTALNPNPAFTGQATNLAMMNPGAANTNKIRPTGPVDPAVTALSLQTRDGQPLALLANYSTHYGPTPSDAISACYFGEVCRRLTRELATGPSGSKFVALMSNGTSGDANWIDWNQPGKTYTVTNQANAVVRAVLEALQGATYRENLPLVMIEKRLSLNVRLPTAQQVTAARQYLAANGGGRNVQIWEANYARETTLMADWPATKEIKLQAIGLGDFGIAAIPCEVFGSTGLAIKQASPFPLTMVIELANGASGYLPPPEQFALGGYTTWRARSSYLEAGAEPRIGRQVVELLNLVYPKSRP